MRSPILLLVNVPCYQWRAGLVQWWELSHWVTRSRVRSGLSADFTGGRLASVFPFPRPHSCGSLRHWVCPYMHLVQDSAVANRWKDQCMVPAQDWWYQGQKEQYHCDWQIRLISAKCILTASTRSLFRASEQVKLVMTKDKDNPPGEMIENILPLHCHFHLYLLVRIIANQLEVWCHKRIYILLWRIHL